MLNIILLIIISLSLSAILVIIGRHWHEILVIKPETIPGEREKMLKQTLVSERIRRIMRHKLNPLVIIYEQMYDFLHNVWHRWYRQTEKLAEREQEKRLRGGSEIRLSATLENLLDEARRRAEEAKFKEAEKKYLEVIKLDPKNIEAYRGLGDVYIAQKQYTEAKEIYSFLIKLNSVSVNRKSDYFFNLALIHKSEGSMGEAYNYGLQALELVPNNPRYLDFIIDLSIIEGDKVGARKHLAKLKEVNPENQKISSWEEMLK